VTQASLASTPPCPARSPHAPLNHRQTFFRHVSLGSGAEFLSHPGNSQQISFCEIRFQTAGSSPSSDPLLTRQSRPQAEQAGERHGAGTDETRSGLMRGKARFWSKLLGTGCLKADDVLFVTEE